MLGSKLRAERDSRATGSFWAIHHLTGEAW
jgi:hypothetical protein